jgi:RNA polymerase sigma-54 factor
MTLQQMGILPRLELRPELKLNLKLQQRMRIRFANCLRLSRDDLDRRIREELDANLCLRREGPDFAQNPDRDGFWQYLCSIVSHKESLQSTLIAQLNAADADEKTRDIGEVIIANLDERGYLACDIKDIAEEIGVSEAFVQKTLDLIHQLEPTGVAARSVEECLVLQIAREYPAHKNELTVLVESHLWDLAKERYPYIADAMGIPITRVRELKEMLASLDPWPGRAYSNETPQYIVPDVVVDEVDGEFITYLADDATRGLSIDAGFKRDLALLGASDAAKAFRSQMRAAKSFLELVELRRHTILMVAREIVAAQGAFFRKGVTALKPLRLRDIAEALEIDNSTVQRATTGKYAQTPQGVFELSYFFSSGIEDASGEGISAKAIKEHIRLLVAKENYSRPLSDGALVVLLAQLGIPVARRTVAKYRNSLKILSVGERKKGYRMPACA